MEDARKKRDSINLFRGAAALLLAASLLCTLAGQTLAASEPVSSPVSDNRPAVVIEGNAVVDSNGQPTGFFELSMKVRTKFYLDAEGKLVDSASAAGMLDHPFRSAAVALRYDAELLTPVSWSYTPEDYAADVPGLDVSGANALKPAYLETKKPDNGVSATAKVESYTASDANNSGRPTAQLVLSAEAGGTAVSYEQETAVCVVRFKYDLDRVTMRAGDNYAFLRPAATPTGADGKKFCVVWFAEDAVAAKSSAGQSVWYQGTKSIAETAQADRTYFYYYLDAPAMTAAGAPKTDGGTVFTGSPVKDYTSNLLSLQETGDPAMPGKVQFKLVNMPSYASGGVNMANMATILFYDWDDALLGVLTVEKGDARAAVNAYIEGKMIYPDLWASKHAGDAAYMDSLDRAYTYRGTYPAEGPSGSTIVADGDKYALTNKLDYAFYRRPTELVEPAPTDPEGTAAYWEVASNASSEEAYPYVNGWAVVADIKEIENVWTTFGAGELKDVNPAAASGRYTTAGTAANYFKLEDFSNLTPGIHYVKACYEPGSLLDLNNFYTITSGVSYMRANTYASIQGGNAYTIGFEYERVSAGQGVVRTREPSVRISYVPEEKGKAGNSFYVEGSVNNRDIMKVEVTPASSIQSMTYMLGDKYEQNSYTTGAQRSQNGNEANIPTNFNYGDWTYEQRLGTDGFVFRATLNQILRYGTLAVESGRSEDKSTLEGALNLNTLKDINLKFSTTVDIDDMNLSIVQERIFDSIQKAYDYGSVNADGDVVLDWHQLQYHIINYNTGGILQEGRILTPEECGGFAWCRLDECGGNGPTVVVTFQDLLIAGYKAYVEGVVSPAMDSLTLDKVNSFYLRKDVAGSEFATVDDFKAVFSSAMQKLAAGGYMASTISNADWIELQHALLPSTTYQTAANLRANPAIDYWWEAGKTPGITDLSTLLKVAYRVYVDGGSSADLSALTMGTVDGFYLRADIGGHKFTGLSDFENALKVAVQKLKTGGFYSATTVGSATWEELQYTLIHGAYQLPPITEDYWWKNGNTPDINTFADLAAIGYRVYVDGNDPSMLDKLFAMNSVTNAPMWLRANADGDAFLSIAKVKETLDKAVRALQTAGKTAEDMRMLTWLEFQNVMLGNPYKSDADLQLEVTAGSIDYWWYNGGSRPLKTFPALLEAADKAAGGDSSLLDTLIMDVLNSVAIGLRADFKGTPYTDLSAFKIQITAMVTVVISKGDIVADLTWNEVQYYLVHGVLASSAIVADKEGNAYYWWYNGGEGSAAPITPGISQASLSTLLETAYRADTNANPRAWDNLTAAMTETFRLVRDRGTATAWTDLTKYDGATLSSFQSALENLVKIAIAVGDSYTAINWFQIQHFLLTGTYLSASDVDLPGTTDYWWRDNESDPNASGGSTPLDEFLQLMTNFAATSMGTADANVLKEEVDSYYISNKLDIRVRANAAASILPYEDIGVTTTFKTQVKNRVVNLVKALKNNDIAPYYDSATGEIHLTWYQLQYYSYNMNNITATATSIVSPEDAYNYYLTLGDHNWAPTWASPTLARPFFAIPLELVHEDLEGPPAEGQEEPAPPETETPDEPVAGIESGAPETDTESAITEEIPPATSEEEVPSPSDDVVIISPLSMYPIEWKLAPAAPLAISPAVYPALLPSGVSTASPVHTLIIPTAVVPATPGALPVGCCNQTMLYRRAILRKKGLTPANQGGINV